jgi:predicted secreted hydrolase
MHFATSDTDDVQVAALRTAVEPPLLPVRLPRDELRHPHTMEWWYFIAHVQTSSGRKASVLCSAIRKSALLDVTNCILKITDHERGPWPFVECGQPLYAAYRESENPVSFTIDYMSDRLERLTCFDGGWRIDGKPGRYRLHGSVDVSDFGPRAFDLYFQAHAPAQLLSESGIMDYGGDYKLAYYVRPKIAVSGTLQLTDRAEDVTGVGWYERQWGAWPGDRFGWKYLNVHLDDGEQWLIYLSLRNGLSRRYAARFPRTGGKQEYEVQPDDFREIRYGDRFSGTDVTVRTEGGSTEFRVRPLHPDDESLRSRYPLMPTIWEGVSSVECIRPDGSTESGVAMTEIKPHE